MYQNAVRILIVDDEPKFVKALTFMLQASGYQTLAVFNGERALEIIAEEDIALILLDVRMPGLDGFETCRRIREFWQNPIIMLTALSQKSDIAYGLKAGADGYITKPFSADELLARLEAALRRSEPSAFEEERPFQSGDLLVDYAGNRVFVDGEEIVLTRTEYYLLCALTRAAGRVVSTNTLLNNVWGSGYEGEHQLVQRMMNRLRSKIEPDADSPRFIITRQGLGYMIEK